jgi:hypothetical protein
MSGRQDIANGWQQVLPAGAVVVLALRITFVSFNAKDPQPYLFPRLIAVAMLGLSLMAFGRAVGGRNRTGRGLHSRTLRNIWPAHRHRQQTRRRRQGHQHAERAPGLSRRIAQGSEAGVIGPLIGGQSPCTAPALE